MDVWDAVDNYLVESDGKRVKLSAWPDLRSASEPILGSEVSGASGGGLNSSGGPIPKSGVRCSLSILDDFPSGGMILFDVGMIPSGGPIPSCDIRDIAQLQSEAICQSQLLRCQRRKALQEGAKKPKKCSSDQVRSYSVFICTRLYITLSISWITNKIFCHLGATSRILLTLRTNLPQTVMSFHFAYPTTGH